MGQMSKLTGGYALAPVHPQPPIGTKSPPGQVSPQNKKPPITHCVLCRSNGEPYGIVMSHTLRDSNQNVTCPVLLRYTCPICNAKGSHTISYCPLQNSRRARSSCSAGYLLRKQRRQENQYSNIQRVQAPGSSTKSGGRRDFIASKAESRAPPSLGSHLSPNQRLELDLILHELANTLAQLEVGHLVHIHVEPKAGLII